MRYGEDMRYDVVIAGGGPAGLAAALTLGRARKRTLLCDAGSPRNAAARLVQNFVTRDGIPPAEFRRIAREQLAAYPNVETRDTPVEAIHGASDAFAIRLGDGRVDARRILLCTGMIDETPAIEGMRALWGTHILQCPYCHGWEIREQRFGYLATTSEKVEFALLLRGWTGDVVLFTEGRFALPTETRAQLAAAGVVVEERPIVRLQAHGDRLAGVEVAGGYVIPRDVLFMHPPQRQTNLVRALGVSLDAAGFVRVDEARRETSVAGIYAAGDLVSPAQGALLAAASGTLAASRLNHALTVEMAATGALA